MDAGLAGGPARAPQPEHEGGDRGRAVDGAGAARAEPDSRHFAEQCRPHYQRPQQVWADRKLLVQAFDQALRFGSRAGIGGLPLGLLPLVFGANVLVATVAWITVWLVTR
jgi:hypothetical protein